MSLTGRVAVVTGGSRGIGRAIAVALARRGASVAICYREREDAGARDARRSFEGEGVKALAARCDVRDEASVNAFFKQVASELGPVDILVNNAGIVRDGFLMFMDRSRWDEVLDTNLGGAFLCIRAVARDMLLRRWGRIINIVSASGDVGARPGELLRVEGGADRPDAARSRASSPARACWSTPCRPG